MTILVDAAVWRRPDRDTRFAHLASDTSFDELHAFARRLGIERHRFQGDHYDVPSWIRDEALRHGATAVTSREIVRGLRAAGLRRRGRDTTRAQGQLPRASTV